MDIIYLPIEIIYNIISYINDTNDYKNLRITCQSLYYCMMNLKCFYNNGSIKSITSFYNHKLCGIHTSYTNNGVLSCIIPFVNNKIPPVV